MQIKKENGRTRIKLDDFEYTYETLDKKKALKFCIRDLRKFKEDIENNLNKAFKLYTEMLFPKKDS